MKPPCTPANALRLMTVHASKGLEFPMVVLADASRRRPASGGLLLADAAHGLSCQVYDPQSSRYESGYAHKRNRALLNMREAAEEKRLLYVAATRAQDYLLVSGQVWNKDGAWTADGFLWQLLEALELTTLQPAPLQTLEFTGHPLRIAMPLAPPAQAFAPAQLADDSWQLAPEARQRRAP